MRVKLFLSDHAWDSLSREAYTRGWVRQVNTVDIPGYTSRHIARFFEALGTLTYLDVRPEQFEGTCVWCEGEITRVHAVSIDPEALSLLAGIAIRYRIPPRWYTILLFNEKVTAEPTQEQYAGIIANNHTTVPGLASAALEAIGVRYLAPPVFPTAPDDLFKGPQRVPGGVGQRVSVRLGFG